MGSRFALVVCCLSVGYVVSAKTDIQKLIYNGQNAVRGEFPYMVRTLLYRRINKDSYAVGFCGGSLIAPQWVVSAAHCARRIEFVRALLGLLNTRDSSGVLNYTIPRSNIFMHPNYTSSAFTNDVVLYKLPQSVPFANYSNINMISIPNLSSNSVSQYNGRLVTAVGWGRIQNGSLPQALQYVIIRVLSNSKCQNITRAASTTTICTERIFKNAGPCFGDSGGPLVANSSTGRAELIGITSFVSGRSNPCSDVNGVAGYAYAPSFRSWINGVIATK